ncbi:MAG TPA: cobalamin biosynthesis protein CobD [Clostridiaceae bacterium]|nr:cobalamin biosynthesis protein CobD [Clostridiaceae bacterium]
MLLFDVFIAFTLDLILGDPYWLPHPVRIIGWAIKKTEKFLRKIIDKLRPGDMQTRGKHERIAGTFLMVFVVSVTFLLVHLILKIALLISPVLFHILNIYFIYSSLAAKCMAEEAMKVYKKLMEDDIVESRKQLAMLVGRQTEGLSEKEIIRGVVETTAENTVDGILSPLIYTFIGSFFGISAPLVYAFKAISTLDSMVGYMNDKYINMGRTSAKTDDVANYIPARLAGFIIPLAALLCGKNMKGSFRIMLRDRHNHKSPNCAYPEAAVAGALGIKIGGTNIYFGQTVEKPTIGDAVKDLERKDIRDTIRLMYAATFLTVLFEGLITIIILAGRI